nr:hypothetical protein [Kordiimonas pumila]
MDNVINEVDRTLLRVTRIDLQGSNTRCIINGCILVPLDLAATSPFEYQKLNIHLNVVARHPFLISFGMDLPVPHIVR